MCDDFPDVADFCRNDRSPAGESFAQHDWRCFGAQRRNHHDVGCSEDIWRVPTVTDREDAAAQTGAANRQPYFCAKLQRTSALTDDNKPRIWPLFQDEPGCFDKNRLPLVRPNHADVGDKRRVRRYAEFAAEFDAGARWVELL